MPIVLSLVGAGAVAFGLVLVVHGIDIYLAGAHMAAMAEFRLAAPLMLGGMLLIGVAAMLRQLRRLADAVEALMGDHEER